MMNFDECIYHSTVSGREGQVSKVSFDIILRNIFQKTSKTLQLNAKGKWTLKMDSRGLKFWEHKID